MPKISVCMTHYNRPDKLAATLESLARQTRLPDEVFLWDDCSPNDPTKIACSFAGRFPHFVYHRNVTNVGMPRNLNDVIRQATGDYVANLHDADEFHPTLLEKWADTLSKYPDAGLVFCGLDDAAKSGGTGKVWLHDVETYTSGREFFRRHYLGSSSSKIWGTVMVRRSVYEAYLPFDEQFRNWADVDMWMRICRTHGIAYVREALLVLDRTPTAQREFSWGKFIIVHRMPFVNIYRMANTPSELCEWLKIQRRAAYILYLRHLAARAMRGRWRSLLEGLGLAKSVFVQLDKAAFFLAEGERPRSVVFRPVPGR